MAASSIYEVVEEECVDGLVRRRHFTEKPLPLPRPKAQKTTRAALGASDYEARMLCMLAAERKENDALRKYAAWLTTRVQALEQRLFELRETKNGNLR